jgi:hypothetical protein
MDYNRWPLDYKWEEDKFKLVISHRKAIDGIAEVGDRALCRPGHNKAQRRGRSERWTLTSTCPQTTSRFQTLRVPPCMQSLGENPGPALNNEWLQAENT